MRPMKALTFSYDDGITYDKKLIEIFNRYGMKATFNIITGNSELGIKGWYTSNGVLVKRGDHADPSWRAIYEGHELACHTRNHPWLNKISDELLEDAILGNRKDIQEIFGYKPMGMAYPFNTYDDRCVKILRENGFVYAREGFSTHSFELQSDLLRFCPTCHHNDEQLFELAEEFIEMKPEKPQIFYVWGHSYDFEHDQNWDRIERFCEMMAGRDDIFYGTNLECFVRSLDFNVFAG